MNYITEADLVDYLAGELPNARRAEVTAALAGDPALRAGLTELAGLMEEIVMEAEPAPSAAADDRFAAMLATAAGGISRVGNENGTNETGGHKTWNNENRTNETGTNENQGFPGSFESSVTPGYNKRPSGAKMRSLTWKIAGVAAAIALVFLAGRVSVGDLGSDLDQEFAANRTLMLELMKDERTSARIRATTVTLTLPATDPVTTANLGYLLRNDENANVRLAALDALRRFPRDPGVRAEMLAAMNESPPDVVRFELIETLVRLGEKSILPYLEDIMDADSLPQPMRDAAEMASFKLI